MSPVSQVLAALKNIISRNNPLSTISKLLGHSSTKMTKGYVHIPTTPQAIAVNNFDYNIDFDKTFHEYEKAGQL